MSDTVTIEVQGREYQVPKRDPVLVNRRLKQVDRMIQRQDRRAGKAHEDFFAFIFGPETLAALRTVHRMNDTQIAGLIGQALRASQASRVDRRGNLQPLRKGKRRRKRGRG